SRHFTYAPTDGCGSDSHDFLPILRCLCSDAFSSAAASPARRGRSGLTVPPLGRQAGFVGLAQGAQGVGIGDLGGSNIPPGPGAWQGNKETRGIEDNDLFLIIASVEYIVPTQLPLV